MKIFIIGSVRNVNKEQKEKMEEYAEELESIGNIVHLPHRDTNQKARGIEICNQNRTAIKEADEVHVFYSSDSEGTHFDLGMAFAMGKIIRVISNEKYGEGKSFSRMLVEWSEECW